MAEAIRNSKLAVQLGFAKLHHYVYESFVAVCFYDDDLRHCRYTISKVHEERLASQLERCSLNNLLYRRSQSILHEDRCYCKRYVQTFYFMMTSHHFIINHNHVLYLRAQIQLLKLAHCQVCVHPCITILPCYGVETVNVDDVIFARLQLSGKSSPLKEAFMHVTPITKKPWLPWMRSCIAQFLTFPLVTKIVWTVQ